MRRCNSNKSFTQDARSAEHWEASDIQTRPRSAATIAIQNNPKCSHKQSLETTPAQGLLTAFK